MAFVVPRSLRFPDMALTALLSASFTSSLLAATSMSTTSISTDDPRLVICSTSLVMLTTMQGLKFCAAASALTPLPNSISKLPSLVRRIDFTGAPRSVTFTPLCILTARTVSAYHRFVLYSFGLYSRWRLDFSAPKVPVPLSFAGLPPLSVSFNRRLHSWVKRRGPVVGDRGLVSASFYRWTNLCISCPLTLPTVGGWGAYLSLRRTWLPPPIWPQNGWWSPSVFSSSAADPLPWPSRKLCRVP